MRDSPLAEKRAAALALDPALLAKLLGTVELRELLDPEIIAQVHAQLQRTAEDRRARTTEEVADLLRLLGPVPVEEMAEHTNVPLSAIESLGARVMRVRIGGREHFAQPLDAPLLRDALGVPVPPGVPAQQATITDALQQLVSRWARTRGPFVLRDLQDAFGLSASTAHTALQSIDTIVEGRYRQGIEEAEYCAAEVLRTIAPVPWPPRARDGTCQCGDLWPLLAGLAAGGPVGKRPALRGADGVFSVIEQLAGVRLPTSAWESLILPARVGTIRRRCSMSSPQTARCSSSVQVRLVRMTRGSCCCLPTTRRSWLRSSNQRSWGSACCSLQRWRSCSAAVASCSVTFSLRCPAPRMSCAKRCGRWWRWAWSARIPLRRFARTWPRRARGQGLLHAALSDAHPFPPAHGPHVFAQSQGLGGASAAPDVAGRWAASVSGHGVDATSRSVAHGEAWLDRYGVVTRGRRR